MMNARTATYSCGAAANYDSPPYKVDKTAQYCVRSDGGQLRAMGDGSTSTLTTTLPATATHARAKGRECRKTVIQLFIHSARHCCGSNDICVCVCVPTSVRACSTITTMIIMALARTFLWQVVAEHDGDCRRVREITVFYAQKKSIHAAFRNDSRASPPNILQQNIYERQ